MIVTTVLQGISQKLKMTITWSLEANFLTKTAEKFFSRLEVCLGAVEYHGLNVPNRGKLHN